MPLFVGASESYDTDAWEAYSLKKENVKLRDERDRMYKANVEKNGEILRLLGENAKLRELLQDYHRYEHEDCYSCRYINECRADESGRCIAPMRLGERYRELGVEAEV